jgi:two-component system, OmpR family, sensor histidine kinase BaeS
MKPLKQLFVRKTRIIMFLVISSISIFILALLLTVQYFQFNITVKNEMNSTLIYLKSFATSQLNVLYENGRLHSNSAKDLILNDLYNMGVYSAYIEDEQIIYDSIQLPLPSFTPDPKYSVSSELFVNSKHTGRFLLSVKTASGLLHMKYERMYLNYWKKLKFNLVFLIPLILILSYMVAHTMSQPVYKIIKWISELGENYDVIPPLPKGVGEFKHIQKELYRLVQRILENEKWRKSLLEDLGHEIRTPLCIVSMQLEALADGVYPPTADAHLTIYIELNRLTTFFDDIQTLHTAEGSRFELNNSQTDIRTIVQQVHDLFKIPCKNKGIELKTEMEFIPFYSYCDFDKIKQSLINLVSNAMKYTEPNGQIIISVEKEIVEDKILIKVADTGIGIDASELENIFKRFYRIKTPIYRSVKGSGIGLSIAKSYLEAHGGRILVESRLSKGSVFTIELPVYSKRSRLQ